MSRNSSNVFSLSLYVLLSIAYFLFFDSKFYSMGILAADIAIYFPFPYILLTALFIFTYVVILKHDLKTAIYPVCAVAVALPFVYLLNDLKVGVGHTNPFGGQRGVYGICMEAYYLVFMTLFSLLSAASVRALKAAPERALGEEVSLHIPIISFFIFIELFLLLNGLGVYAALFIAIAFVSGYFRSAHDLVERAKALALKIIRNEYLFLALIFTLAFLIRYLWGERLIALTGERFILASDDGQAYDPMAAMLAQGQVLPKKEALALNGFGYWYFLAGIYKVFGLHNFKALVFIQAILNASVPVSVYLIAKKICNNRFAAATAGILTVSNLGLIFLSGVIGMEALYIPLFFMALASAVYLLALQHLNYLKAFLMGGLFGLANTARGELLAAPFILSFVWLIFKKNRGSIGTQAFTVAAIFFGFFCVASIQPLTNYHHFKEFRFTQTALKHNFTNTRYGDENAVLDKMGFNPFKDISRSLAALVENPIHVGYLVAKGSLRRTVTYYLVPNFGVFDPIFLVNPASGYFFRFPVFLQFFGYLMVLYGAVSILMKKGEAASKALVFILLAYITSIYGFVMFQNVRNRGVLIPIAALFVAYGISLLYYGTKKAITFRGQASMNIRSNRIRRFAITFLVIASVIGIMNIDTFIRQGADGHLRKIHMPLYIKLMEFVSRDYEYQRISREITGGLNTDEEKVLAIFEWTKENIHHAPKNFTIYDDHILNIIIRGYGTGDQFQDVFTTLCSYAGFPSFCEKAYSKDRANSAYLSFVKMGGKWRVFDAYHAKLFRTKYGEIASIEDMSQDDSLVSGDDIDKIEARTGQPYREFYQNLATMEKKRDYRPEQQMPIKRITYELRRRIWR